MHLSRLLSVGFVFACVTMAAHAATYHLDADAGNDSADGLTPATAWQSLAKANAIVYLPGDSLLLKSGAIWTGRLQPQGSGTAGSRIVIDRYGSGPKPVLHGGGIAGGTVTLENAGYWTIRNLEVTNNGTSEPKKMGIQVRNDCVGTLSGIEVRDCYVHDVTGVMNNYIDGKESGGIVFQVTVSNLAVPSKWENIVIEGNTIRKVIREGILMQSLWINKPLDPNSSWDGAGPYLPSENIRIASNTLEDIGGDGIIPWCVKNAIIEYNLVRRSNNNSLGQGHAALWPYFCEDVIMQFNEVCETKTTYDGMAFDFDNSDQRCIYQYNYTHDNEGGFLNMCCDGNGNGNIARFNISQNDGCIPGGRVFLVHGNGNHGYKVYNNTIFVSRNNPPVFEQGAASTGSDITFKNNIFINSGTGSFNAPGGCIFDNNLYHGNGHIANDPRKILADPLLVLAGSGANGLASLNGYKLLAGSPALGSGLVIEDNGGLDYWGNTVSPTIAPNVGAYNGIASPPITPTSAIWTREADGLWTDGASWQGGAMAIGSGMAAKIPVTTPVTVQQPVDDFPLGGFVFSGANHVVTGGSFLLFDGTSYLTKVGSGQRIALGTAFALRFGIVPESSLPQVIAWLRKQPAHVGGYGGYTYYHAAYAAGGLGDLIVSDLIRYQYMLAGNRTIWESFARPSPDNETNHAWTAYPAAIFPRYIAGISPTGPAFSTFSIMPETRGLRHAKATVPTVRGDISSDWQRISPTEFRLTCTIPGNTTALVHLPLDGLKDVTIKESGTTLWTRGVSSINHPGITFETADSRHVRFKTGSGTYNFTATGTAVPLPPLTVICDNDKPAVTLSGSWANNTINEIDQRHELSFEHAPAGDGSSAATFRPNLPAGGRYKVFARWTSHANRATNAPFTIHHSMGKETILVNQEQNGGKWNLLGEYEFASGTAGHVVLTNEADGFVVADAVAFISLAGSEAFDQSDAP